ncbi:MAG: hypothetical protein RLN99_19115 [Kiloniellaceae bacterium]
MDLQVKARRAVLLLLAPLLGVTAAPAAAEEAYLTISEADCARLTRHYPAPLNSTGDVTYQPGSDVRGKPVTPADLNGGGGLILPDAVVIPIEVDLFERYGIPANSANFKGDIFIGEVVVDVASGRATFNGQPLQTDAEAELAARCQRIVRDRAPAR